MGSRLNPSRLAAIVAFFALGAPAFAGPKAASDAGANPWQELTERQRQALSPVLRPTVGFTLQDGGFQTWFKLYYCPDGASGCQTEEKLKERFAEWRFNSLTLGQRATTACVVSLLHETFGGRIPAEIGALDFSGDRGDDIVFRLDPGKGGEAWEAHEALKKQGFTTDFNANKGKTWGLRSPIPGYQLHCYRKPELERRFNCHVDPKNPGKSSGNALRDAAAGSDHIYHDLWGYGDRTAHEMVAQSGNGCGLGASDLLMLAQNAQSDAARRLREQARFRSPESFVSQTREKGPQGYADASSSSDSFKAGESRVPR